MDKNTTAPDQTYPIPVPKEFREPEKPQVKDDRPPANMVDQKYPVSSPAPKSVERTCPCCGKPQ